MASDGDRLISAVTRALLPRFEPCGLRLGPTTSGNRGSSATVMGDGIEVQVHADWLEGEVVVEVHRPGEPVVTALHLRRLPRDVTVGVLESRLSKAADGVVAEVKRRS